MDLRARQDTPMSHDITPRIAPIAASLHDKFLNSHCSACFRPLSSSSSTTPHPTSINPLLSCTTCSTSVQYCSTDCAAADLHLHTASGECRLLMLHALSPFGDTTDVRVALRLLYSFERLALLPCFNPCPDSPRRIGGLLAEGLIDLIEEGGELSVIINEGAALMMQARNARLARGCSLDVSIEQEVLWVVTTNAVEVEIGELGGIGVAVYGPSFSWFNHSCLPNACYRFELSSRFRGCEFTRSLVFPGGGDGEALDTWNMWNHIESGFADDICLSGPRIIIRSIKELKKNDEICIAYTDLLQPRIFQHIELSVPCLYLQCIKAF